LESQQSVAEQQVTSTGSGQLVGDGTNAGRTDNGTENDEIFQTATGNLPGQDSGENGLTKTKSEGTDGGAHTTNSANDDKQTTTTIETDKLHIQIGPSAKVGDLNGAGRGLESATDIPTPSKLKLPLSTESLFDFGTFMG